MGFEIVAVNILELAVSPGLDEVEALGGLAAFTGWKGPIGAVQLGEPGSGVHGAATGLRARRRPVIISATTAALRVRSTVDGSIHELGPGVLDLEARRLGATSWRDLAPEGTEIRAWEDADDPLPGRGWVVSAAPGEAGRQGRYRVAGAWAQITAIADAATPGPLVRGCGCRTCAIAGAGYVAHLWDQGEITAAHLLGAHNLHCARHEVEA
jgi:queuine/archaeosine tRNA-ribosyltransferase